MIYLSEENYGFQKGLGPLVTATGSYKRTCVFGTLTVEDKQYFISIMCLTPNTFLDYIK
jgi:hypothetical protein